MADAGPRPVFRLRHSLTYGNIWLSVLSLLKGGKLYAYALPETIERRFSFKPSRLMTYFVLYKLEDEGLISSEFEGRRKYYRLAPKGRAALAQGRAVLSSFAKRL